MDAFDVVVVGGGTAGCVLAARLSEDPARRVCLLEAGPDHGPRDGGGWPPELVSAHELAFSHDWGTGGEDGRSLGARVIGGCSAHNACMVIAGTEADYDEWGAGWDAASMRPYLRRARAGLATQAANTGEPAPMHEAFMAAAVATGFELLDDLDDPARPVGIGPYAANVDGATRRNAAFAYLDPARGRPNLTVQGDTLVDRVAFAGEVASGVVTADGRTVEAGLVVLAAGAYLTPAVLLRSGIGPEAQLRALGIRIVIPLPVGERLLDHCGNGLAFEPSDALHAATAAHAAGGPLFESHAILKARSSACAQDTFDLHLLPWTNRTEAPGRCTATVGTFLVKPRSHGSVRLRSADPADLPIVERGFLRDARDLAPLVEAIELTRRIAAQPPLAEALRGELRPGPVDLEAYVRETVRCYYHPAGTCPIGDVLDRSCRVHGVERLVVADASVMPTIPRANTNLTTAAIAERVAEALAAG